eukprot:c26410_g1_i1 orf=278-1396(+)
MAGSRGRSMGEEAMALPPWEHHHSAINLPRYDYSAALDIACRSFPGFLITCTFDREKSSTKEATAILKEYIFQGAQEPKYSHAVQGEANEATHNSGRKKHRQEDKFIKDAASGDVSGKDSCEPIHDADSDLKSTRMEVGKTLLSNENNSNSFATKEEGTENKSIPLKGDTTIEETNGLFPLKLSRKGIIFIILRNGLLVDTVDILLKLLCDIESGAKKRPQWCHRILPVQATCLFTKDGLNSVVLKLVKQHLGESVTSSECPLKYAVGFNRRGVGDFRPKDNSNSMEYDILGRMDCINLVAGAVKKVAPYAVVDLSAPQMVVMVEVIPVSGLQAPICAMSVLPREAVNVKPKLCVKSLILTSHQLKKRKEMD